MSKKIPVSAPQQPLQSPFSTLEINGLPEATASVPLPHARNEKPKKRHRIVLRRETAHRGGKTVVVITQLPTHLSPPEIEKLARDARKSLGCGGAVHGREIELQGDMAARVRTYFEGQGFLVGGV